MVGGEPQVYGWQAPREYSLTGGAQSVRFACGLGEGRIQLRPGSIKTPNGDSHEDHSGQHNTREAPG